MEKIMKTMKYSRFLDIMKISGDESLSGLIVYEKILKYTELVVCDPKL